MAMGDPQPCGCCGRYVLPHGATTTIGGGGCGCFPETTSFTTYQVPIPTWLNEEQKRKFASKHIEMQKGNVQAGQEIDDMFMMLIDGYKLNKELSESKTEEETNS